MPLAHTSFEVSQTDAGLNGMDDTAMMCADFGEETPAC
jgi:hypothetical protein